MKKFIVVSVGVDEDGEWAHQCVPGLFKSPDSALESFKKDWVRVEFELHQLESGTFQVLRYEDGNTIVEGLIIPVETRRVSGRRA